MIKIGLVFLLALIFVGSAQTITVLPTIYFKYTNDCTFTIIDDSGNSVTTIPPGLYQVDVRTPLPFGTVNQYGITGDQYCKGFVQFQLTGPGVNLFTTLTAGCMSEETFPETFQANQTYTAVDNSQPTIARESFTIAATGSPVSPTIPTTVGKPSTQVPIVGSGIKKKTIHKPEKIHLPKLGW